MSYLRLCNRFRRIGTRNHNKRITCNCDIVNWPNIMTRLVTVRQNGLMIFLFISTENANCFRFLLVYPKRDKKKLRFIFFPFLCVRLSFSLVRIVICRFSLWLYAEHANDDGNERTSCYIIINKHITSTAIKKINRNSYKTSRGRKEISE